MNDEEILEPLRTDVRPIMRSIAAMRKHGFGRPLCPHVARVLDEYLWEPVDPMQSPSRQFREGLGSQFALEVGLFSLLHGENEQGAAALVQAITRGNLHAALAVWVADQRLGTDRLACTPLKDHVLEVIGACKCHYAFLPVVEQPDRTKQAWKEVLLRLRGAFEVGIYVRAVLNLTLGRECEGIRDLAAFGRASSRYPFLVDAAVLSMWAGQLDRAHGYFQKAESLPRAPCWLSDYRQALPHYGEISAAP